MINLEYLTTTSEVLLVLFLLAICVIAFVYDQYRSVKFSRDDLRLDLEYLRIEMRKGELLQKVNSECIKKLRIKADDLEKKNIAKDRILTELFSTLSKADLEQMIADLKIPPRGNKEAEDEVCELLKKAISD